MREHLFRGKRVDGAAWVYGVPWEAVNGTGLWYMSGPQQFDGETIMAHIQVDPATVGQYTGKDVKSGKVFQDDIGKSIDGLFLVLWSEEKAAYIMQFYDYPNEQLYLEEMWDDAEIIGNIHDNPELLEGTT